MAGRRGKTACIVAAIAVVAVVAVFAFAGNRQAARPPADFQQATVDYVIDGDTIDVMLDGHEKRVRLAGTVESGFGEVRPQGLFEIGADCRNLVIRGVSLGFPSEVYASGGGALVSVGPKSSTWKQGHDDPALWAELFEPDLVCTAENVTLGDIRFSDGPCTDERLLIRARRLTLNEDYPRTTPRGGTGYGVVRGVSVI